MINIKKGTAHSLTQSDFVGLAKANEGVDAGMVVRIDSSGNMVKGPTNAAAADDRLGLAITTQSQGDAIASGKISAYALDGNSVIGTDYVTGSLSSFAVGQRVSADPTNLGNVRAWQTGDRIFGYVDSVSDVYVGFTAHQLLFIKLAV